MGLFTPDVKDLRELYITKLQKALSSEQQIVETGLPTMIQSATDPELRQAFTTHLEESKIHAQKVEAILRELTGEAATTKCKGTATLIAEGGSEAGDADNTAVRDVILISGGNAIEHHEIATYGTLRTWADTLGESEQAAVLESILEEEKLADEKLTMLAEQINIEATV